jgi:hypothetical protein
MQFVHSYLTLLLEAYQDMVALFESDTARGFVIGALVLIPLFGTLFFFAVLVSAAEPVPASPTSLAITQSGPTTLTVTLTENDTALNAAEVEVLFDAAHFQVTEVLISEALCEKRFVITKETDNETGRVFYQCGTVTPFTGSSTILATLTIRPHQTGTSTAALGAATNVLAHDGLGTNVTGERLADIITTAG